MRAMYLKGLGTQHTFKFFSGIVLVYCILIGFGSTRFLHKLLSRSNANSKTNTTDVALVLGYALFRNGSLTEPLKARVEAGVRAYQTGHCKNIIFSGAHPGGTLRLYSEANAMLKYAMQIYGSIPVDGSWVLEEESTSTRENALYSARVMAEKGWNSVLLVTSMFHQARAELVLKNVFRYMKMQDIKVSVAEVPFRGHKGFDLLDRLVDELDFFRELAALLLYWYRGWL